MKIESYITNILYSYINTPKVKSIDYSEYNRVKKDYYKNIYPLYNKNGNIHKNITGLLFDQKL